MVVKESDVRTRTFNLFQFLHHNFLFLLNQLQILLSHFVPMHSCCPFEPRLEVKRLGTAKLRHQLLQLVVFGSEFLALVDRLLEVLKSARVTRKVSDLTSKPIH